MVFETVTPGWNTHFILFNFRWPEKMRELTQDCNILLKACHGDMRVVPEGIYPECIAVTQCNTGLIFRQFIFFGPAYPKLFLFVVVRVWANEYRSEEEEEN